MTPPSSPASARWAQVQVGDQVTRYLRRGAGAPVVVLGGAGDEAALWPGLVEGLAARCRVILPEVPATDLHFLAWVRGFLDGIGLPPVALIATGDLCVPALELALLDPERLTALVLVPGGEAEEPALSGALAQPQDAAPLPVLVVHRDGHVAETIARVERFVAG